MDSVNLAASFVEIIGGIVIVYLLRKKKREIAFGIGGSVILFGLVLLAIAFDLISGLAVWVITGSVLIILASFFYVAAKRNWASR